MSGIVINPFKPERKTLFDGMYGNAVAVRCALGLYDTLNVSANNNQTVDYTTGFYETFDTEVFNGFLAPEFFPGQMGGLTNFNIATQSNVTAYISITGTVRAIARKRYLLNYPLSAGKTIGNFVFQGHGTTSYYNSSYNAAGSGVTGTMTTTVKCGVLRSGNLTQISSTAQVVNMSNTASTTLIYVPSTDTATTQDGDRVYLDIELDANQTSRSTGSCQISYSTGGMSSTASYTLSSLTFTIS
jgi:hypothetical protein